MKSLQRTLAVVLLITLLAFATAGCSKLAVNGTVARFWDAWEASNASGLYDVLASQVVITRLLTLTYNEADAVSYFLDQSWGWATCEWAKFNIDQIIFNNETGLALAKVYILYYRDNKAQAMNLELTLANTSGNWEINKVVFK